MNLPVDMPKHLFPVLGCAALIGAHVYCLANPSGNKGKANLVLHAA